MPKISALIHACNDALRLGRTLDSLRPCDEVLVIDHGSHDETAHLARQHGASVRSSIAGVEPGAYAVDTRYRWVLCILPGESLSEGMEAALFEWKDSDPDPQAPGFSFPVREHTASGAWQAAPPELRLVNRDRVDWTGKLPPHTARAIPLLGDLLKFHD